MREVCKQKEDLIEAGRVWRKEQKKRITGKNAATLSAEEFKEIKDAIALNGKRAKNVINVEWTNNKNKLRELMLAYQKKKEE